MAICIIRGKVIEHLSDQDTFTPVGAGGGIPWNPPKKTTFPPEFCNKICTIYVRIIKIIILEKIEMLHSVQNGGQITNFLFGVILILAKIWKTTFPKNFSMKFSSK